MKSFKTGHARDVRQTFGSQIEEHFLLYLPYHPQVACYALATLVLRLRPPTNCPCFRLHSLPEALSLTATCMALCPMVLTP